MLYIVSTPIGHLKDITYRAVEVLKQVDLIAAEDTRHTRILTQHYDITTPLTSYFEHNKMRKAPELIARLLDGQDIALVSDAGTPGISDPGFHLMRLAREADVLITVVPGVTALIAALTLSGLPAHAFVFAGFLPVKSAARQKALRALRGDRRTLIFYESPHRLVKALKDVADVLDDPQVVVARELTKRFEETRRGTATQVWEHFSRVKPKGECVLLVNQKEGSAVPPRLDREHDAEV